MDTAKRKVAAEKYLISNRNYRRARERALVRLSRRYNDEYKTLLAEEKARDKENGVAWDSIDGSSRLRSIAITGAQGQNRTGAYPNGAQGNDGGEA